MGFGQGFDYGVDRLGDAVLPDAAGQQGLVAVGGQVEPWAEDDQRAERFPEVAQRRAGRSCSCAVGITAPWATFDRIR